LAVVEVLEMLQLEEHLLEELVVLALEGLVELVLEVGLQQTLVVAVVLDILLLDQMLV
jgi:hypothetical protein